MVRRVLLGCLVVALESSPLSAQTSAVDRAGAEALFDEGRSLMTHGDFVNACTKLEQSQRLDPAVGTLLYLGECYERSGRTASAWATFREAASLAATTGQDERARTGRTRADRLEPKLARLTIQVDPANAAIPGFSVTRAGQPIPKQLWGTPMPVDPGKLEIVARAPDYLPWSTVFTIAAEAEQRSLSVPLLQAGPPSSHAATAAAAPSQPLAPPAREPTAQAGTTQRTLGWITASVGGVAVVMGGYFGLRAFSKNSDAEALCPDPGHCSNQQGVELTDEAKRAANASNAAFAAGAVLLGTGITLVLTAPNTPSTAALRVTPSADLRSIGIDARASF